jgi:hypothetical protein
MTRTLERNGPPRQTLAGRIDRLDALLDGLSEGLHQAVAQAVREAVGLAVREAVQAVLAELLTNPLLREQLRGPAAAQPAAPGGPASKSGGGRGRLAAVCGRVGDKLRSACRVGAGWLRQAAQAARWAWRLAGDRVRAALLAAAGAAAAAAACLARTSLADAARRLCGAVGSLASRAWGALRRALPRLVLCGT